MREMRISSIASPLSFYGKVLDATNGICPPELTGFYYFEQGFVWSQPSSVTILGSKNISKKGLLINLVVPPQTEGRSPELRVAVNGLYMTKVNTSPGAMTLYYPPEEISSFDDIYEISLEHDFSFVPKELGINNDTRKLSLRVLYIGEKK